MFTEKIAHSLSVLLTIAMGLALLVGSLAFPGSARAFGATITVTTAADNTTIDGMCSLREAIGNANNNIATYADCAVGLAGSGDAILFDSALGSATIRLGSILPTISDTTGLTIDGANRITLSGDSDGNGTGNVQMFSVGSNAPLTLQNMTVEKGSSGATWGGAINSSGKLTLQAVTVRNNTSTDQAGAINQAGGTLTISSSTFKDNTTLTGGAAIRYSSGTIVIQDSAFQNNTTTDSGSTYGTISGDGAPNLTVRRSTFDSNVAKYGGGIFFSSGSLLVENSTFSGNGSNSGPAGGIYASDGTVIIKNSTIADNYNNGIMLGSTVILHLDNTILANNTANDCYAYTGAVLGSATHNIIGSLPASPNNCGLTTTPITSLGLAALADNGGPTQTRALLAGSQALDAGDNPTCLATDQRGDTRPLDGDGDSTATCDIGAYEVRPATATTITSDTPDDSLSGASVTVNVSVSSASGTPGGSVNVSMPDSSCVATLTAGSGSCTLNPVTSGIQTITAAYAGDPAHDPSADTESHTVVVSTTFTSSGSQDGWVLETSETSGQGGSLDKSATTLIVGDNTSRKQYRAILSFGTGAGLPDGAHITRVTLNLKKQGMAGGNPLAALRGFMLDVKKGSFGTAVLQTGDFQARGSQTLGPVTPALVSGWYSLDLSGAAGSINELSAAAGLTQIRLRFKLDDNNNAVANLLKLYSGNAPAASRPQLIVEYYAP